MKQRDKKEGAAKLIKAALECDATVKVSDVSKLIVEIFAICEKYSEPYKKAAKAADDAEPGLYDAMMADFTSTFFSNLLMRVDPKNSLKRILDAANEGDLGITTPVKDGAKA